jgi:hypothetical protein
MADLKQTGDGNAGRAPDDAFATAEIAAWLEATAGQGPAVASVAHLPPPPTPRVLRSDASSAVPGAVSDADRVVEHLRQVKHELRKGSDGGGVRAKQLKARAAVLQRHIDQLREVESLRASLGVLPRPSDGSSSDELLLDESDDSGREDGGKEGRDGGRETHAHTGATVSGGGGGGGGEGEGTSEDEDEDADYEPDAVQLSCEALSFSATRVESYIATLLSRVDSLTRSGALAPAALRTVKREVRALECLTQSKAALLCHAVRLMETACATLAASAIMGSRMQARGFDLAELRARLRIFCYARERCEGLAASAARTLDRMDEAPFKKFVRILLHPDVKADKAAAKHAANRCAAAAAERADAEKLVMSLSRTVSAMDEYYQAMLSGEAVCTLLLALQAFRLPGAERDTTASVRAADAARAVSAADLAALDARVKAERLALLAASRDGDGGSTQRLVVLRLKLTLGRQKTAAARLSMLDDVRKQLVTRSPSTPAGEYDRTVDGSAARLATVVLACCDSGAAASQLRIRDDAPTSFTYASRADESQAVLKDLHAAEVESALAPAGAAAQCEVLAGLRLVYADGARSSSALTSARRRVGDVLRPELERLDIIRSRLHAAVGGAASDDGGAGRHVSAPASAPPPVSAAAPAYLPAPTAAGPLVSAPPPASAPPPSCEICLCEAATVRMPCCAAVLCHGCGGGTVALLGRCGLCARACRADELLPVQ